MNRILFVRKRMVEWFNLNRFEVHGVRIKTNFCIHVAKRPAQYNFVRIIKSERVENKPSWPGAVIVEVVVVEHRELGVSPHLKKR